MKRQSIQSKPEMRIINVQCKNSEAEMKRGNAAGSHAWVGSSVVVVVVMDETNETYDQRRYASQYALWILKNKRNQTKPVVAWHRL